MPDTKLIPSPFQELGYDAERCRRRRRLAAVRDGVEAAPVRFLPFPPEPLPAPRILFSAGELPETHDEEMVAINALLPANAPPLSSDEVFIHYMEAANGNFVEDRWLFLGDRTLKNIAADAARGFAFMNSHRTGGLSSPSELPFGKTFAGRYEAYLDKGDVRRDRSLIGFYMLQGIHPNGASGPSTDDLSRMIDGGTLFDVSMGLSGGVSICDICGNELSACDPESGEYLCRHFPGSTRRMSEEEQAAQMARGVPHGKASYTLQDARAAECSGVYDGAVPGAGFCKALALARGGDLDAAELLEARGAYKTLLSRGDFEPIATATHYSSADPGNPAVSIAKGGGGGLLIDTTERKPTPAASARTHNKRKPMSLMDRIKAALIAAEPAEFEELETAVEVPSRTNTQEAAAASPARDTASAVMAAQLKALQEQLAAQQQRTAEEDARRIEADAVRFAADMVREGRALPPEQPAMIAAFQQAAHDDRAVPVKITFGADREGQPQVGTRLEAFQALYTARSPHALYGEMPAGRLPEGVQVIWNKSGDEATKPLPAEEHDRLLAFTETGRAILRERKNGRGA